MSSKIKNKGDLAMMVGFSYNHPSLTYRLFKFKTKSIIHIRDIVWLNKYYSEYFNSKFSSRNLMSPSIPFNEYSESEYNGIEGTLLIIPMDTFSNDEFQEELDNDDIYDNDLSINPINKKTFKELKLLDYVDKPVRSGKTRSETVRNNLSNNLVSIHRLILNTDQIKCDNYNDLVDNVDMDDFKREYKKYLNKN